MGVAGMGVTGMEVAGMEVTGMEVTGTGVGPPVHRCEQPCPRPHATPRCPPAPLSPACPVSPQHSPEAAAGAETWEYGSLWGCRFHLQPRAGDVCRRRCWHRHMVPTQPSPVAPLFLLEGSPVGRGAAGGGLGGPGGKGGCGGMGDRGREGYRDGGTKMEGRRDGRMEGEGWME